MKDKIEIIKKWFLKADHDLGTAIITFEHVPEYNDTVVFHCQQSVEKYLKAYLIYLDIDFKRWHSLVYLLDLISQKDTFEKQYYDKAASIQDYAVEIRYPHEMIELDDSDIREAISIAKEFRELILEKINIRIIKDRIIDK